MVLTLILPQTKIWWQDNDLAPGLWFSSGDHCKFFPEWKTVKASIYALILESKFLTPPKNTCKNWKRWLSPQIGCHQCQNARIVKSQGNMRPPKETRNATKSSSNERAENLWSFWQWNQNHPLKEDQRIIFENGWKSK